MKTIKNHSLSIAATTMLLVGCGSDRQATSINIPEMEPPVSHNAPSGLQLADNSPKLSNCSTGPDCPTIASVLKSRLFGTTGGSIVGLLDTADGRITEIENRTADSYVECFENDGAAVTADFGNNHTVPMTLHCHDILSGPDGSTSGVLFFGRNSSDTYYIYDRTDPNTTSVRGMFAIQDQNENVEVWSAGYDTENGNGGILSHLKSTSTDGVIEFTTAGSPLTDFGVDLICGTQVKLNADYIYVTGKIAAPSIVGNSCAAVHTETHCLDTATFSSQDISLCTTAGLTTFSLTPIVQAHIDNSTWFNTIKLDYQTETQVFTTESIESGPID